ncbi:hypothetical protein GCM10027440_14790 [Nocardiopsis coralliicola]
MAALMVFPLLAGCSGNDQGDDGTDDLGGASAEENAPEEASPEAKVLADVSEEFTEYSDGATAVTYDTEAVPAGSTVKLVISDDPDEGGDDGDDARAPRQDDGHEGHGGEESSAGTGGGAEGTETEFELTVAGLEPDRKFGAHMHTEPCGENPDDSGPHYQDKEDPEQPSTDPAYANDDNEVWLDFATDADGSADSDTGVDWAPRAGEMQSLVIHAEHTKTADGEAGMAGDRLACANVNLD